MGSATIAVILVGLAVGALFRLKMVLLLAWLLLVMSVVFSVYSGFSFKHSAFTIMAAQIVFQGSCFLGLLIRSVRSAILRVRLSL